MLRAAPRTTALVSLLVLSSYLAAAFVDCERPADGRMAEAARIAVWSGAGQGAHPAHAHAHAHASHGAHPAGSIHDPTSHGAHHDAAAHDATSHGAHSASSPAAPAIAAGTDRPAPLVITATCRCGCSETRARVGGNTSRLGATVPGCFVASLPEKIVREGASPIRRWPASIDVPRDPIPI